MNILIKLVKLFSGLCNFLGKSAGNMVFHTVKFMLRILLDTIILPVSCMLEILGGTCGSGPHTISSLNEPDKL